MPAHLAHSESLALPVRIASPTQSARSTRIILPNTPRIGRDRSIPNLLADMQTVTCPPNGISFFSAITYSRSRWPVVRCGPSRRYNQTSDSSEPRWAGRPSAREEPPTRTPAGTPVDMHMASAAAVRRASHTPIRGSEVASFRKTGLGFVSQGPSRRILSLFQSGSLARCDDGKLFDCVRSVRFANAFSTSAARRTPPSPVKTTEARGCPGPGRSGPGQPRRRR
jgi:hypothetical protein